MKNYYRVILGKKNIYADECLKGNFIGADFGIKNDLNEFPNEWKDFKQTLVPNFLGVSPDMSKIALGLACGALHTVAKELKEGDIVLCPNGTGHYHIGEVLKGYSFQADGILPHRREVRWYGGTIERSGMSSSLQNCTGSIATLINITKHANEIEQLITGKASCIHVNTDEDRGVEDSSVFALEKHLEDFLVHNWNQTVLGKDYDIYQNEERLGKQFPTDTGPIDILAISKDKKELLVVELKKGRASDTVVGQIQRYMGFVKEELANEGQRVKGMIIGFEDDPRIRRALSVAPDISFYRYQINFTLSKN